MEGAAPCTAPAALVECIITEGCETAWCLVKKTLRLPFKTTCSSILQETLCLPCSKVVFPCERLTLGGEGMLKLFWEWNVLQCKRGIRFFVMRNALKLYHATFAFVFFFLPF